MSGIPVENNTAFSALAEKLLGVLKLQDLCKDILEVRELKAKNVMDAEAAPNTNVNARNNNGHNRSAFIIKFKLQFISRHVLKVKCKHGILKFKDLLPDGSDNIISVFEMLPFYLNELRIIAKDRANERGYKHVWPLDRCTFVKKTDSSVPIVISTEQDLNNIV